MATEKTPSLAVSTEHPGTGLPPTIADKYPSLEALAKDLGETAYRIICLDRDSKITIVSPHGGFIEAGTSAIARAVANRRWNLFDFQGLQEERAHELHITSTRFRHPRLSKMLWTSAVAVSIHSMGNQRHKTIWLGGLNFRLKDFILQDLVAAGFDVEPESPRYRGIHPLNFVNLACHRGVQLELSHELLDDLFDGQRFFRSRKRPKPTERFSKLVDAVSLSIKTWCQSPNREPCHRVPDSRLQEIEGKPP